MSLSIRSFHLFFIAASLLLASNVQAAVLSLAVMGGAGFLADARVATLLGSWARFRPDNRSARQKGRRTWHRPRLSPRP